MPRDRQTLTVRDPGGLNGPSLTVEIHADEGRFTEARSLRQTVKEELGS